LMTTASIGWYCKNISKKRKKNTKPFFPDKIRKW
jgi:hypothetical protein